MPSKLKRALHPTRRFRQWDAVPNIESFIHDFGRLRKRPRTGFTNGPPELAQADAKSGIAWV